MMMRKLKMGSITVMLVLAFSACKSQQDDILTITPEILKDKIKGGWAGKRLDKSYAS